MRAEAYLPPRRELYPRPCAVPHSDQRRSCSVLSRAGVHAFVPPRHQKETPMTQADAREAQLSASQTYAHVTCPFCGLRCDDLDIARNGQGLTVTRNGCDKAKAGFERPLTAALPRITGKSCQPSGSDRRCRVADRRCEAAGLRRPSYGCRRHAQNHVDCRSRPRHRRPRL